MYLGLVLISTPIIIALMAEPEARKVVLQFLADMADLYNKQARGVHIFDHEKRSMNMMYTLVQVFNRKKKMTTATFADIHGGDLLASIPVAKPVATTSVSGPKTSAQSKWKAPASDSEYDSDNTDWSEAETDTEDDPMHTAQREALENVFRQDILNQEEMARGAWIDVESVSSDSDTDDSDDDDDGDAESKAATDTSDAVSIGFNSFDSEAAARFDDYNPSVTGGEIRPGVVSVEVAAV